MVIKEFLKKKIEMLAVMTLAAIGDVIPIIAIMAGLWVVKKAARFFGFEVLKGLVFNILYLFVLTLVGVLIVTAYNYFYPIDVTSEASVLTVALIFMFFVILDFGLLYFNKPTPTLLAILIVISPLFVTYKLVKDADFIRIDRGTPARLKRYIPLRIV